MMGVDARMTVALDRDLSDTELAQAAGDLVERFGTAPFFLDRDGKYTVGKPTHALERGNEPLTVTVNLAWSYYGPHYERGDPWMYIGIATFLEYRFLDLSPKVRYGGDGDDTLSPFGPKKRAALLSHFLKHGHVPYHSCFGRRVSTMPTCSFCGERPLIDHGGGGDRSFLSCHGCGQNFLLWNDGRLEECEKFL